ncbi:MAG: SDR family NAD(P)-dependent oxidoreductase [Brucellaceae bacterium]|nr:SDR family NAD(P)-dependent oxidoreductase [Brucellaceae bacterium]
MTPGRALVTGGSAGLGRAMVLDLEARGYDVVTVDRSEATPRPGSMDVRCDLSDRAEVDRVLPVLAAAGPFDVVFLNAGANATGRFEVIPFEAQQRILRLNAETPMLMATALAGAGALRGGLCFVSSLSHFTGYPGASAYAASKDAIAVYAKSVRKPFAARGISVTLACPGPLATDHAARHAPPGADPSRRQAPAIAARSIIDATLNGRRLVVPGFRAKLFAAVGYVFPSAVTRRMAALIYDRLDGEVW